MQCLYFCFTSAETFYVTPNYSVPCQVAGQPCLILSDYAAQPQRNFSNITFTFLEGTHNISLKFSLTNLISLTFDTKTLEKGVTILSCSGEGAFMFESIQTILIHNVKVIDCYGSSISHADHVVIADSALQGGSKHSSQVALVLSHIKVLDVFGCTFAWNNVIQLQSFSCAVLNVYQSNMKVYRSVFHKNSAEPVDQHHNYIGSTLCVHGSKISILGSNFTNNYHSAFYQNMSLQGTILALSSDVVVQGSHFTYNGASTAGAILCENSTIRALRTTFSHNSVRGFGGAIFLNEICQLTLENCTVTNNRAKHGGAVYSHGNNTLVLRECIIANNCADKGGVMFLSYSSSFMLDKCNCSDNQAKWGGVVYSEGSRIVVLGTEFIKNHAQPTVCGGATYLSHNSSFCVDDCTFSEDSCGMKGGVMYLTLESKVEVKNTQFQQNTAFIDSCTCTITGDGGVMVLSSSHAIFNDCRFVGNCANIGGFAYTDNQSTIAIIGCSFLNNSARSAAPECGHGGIMYAIRGVKIDISVSKFMHNFASSSGGCAKIIKNSILNISSSTIFENNIAIYGGAFTIMTNSTIHINKNSCNNLVRFTGNSAQHGGALNIIKSSHADIQCSIFEYNGVTFECENTESGISNCRGGAILVRTNTTLSLMNTIFFGNVAHGKGGGLFAQFSTIHSSGNLSFENNQGEHATIYLASCSAKLIGNVSFINNKQSFLLHNTDIVFEGDTNFRGGNSTNLEGGAITSIRSSVNISGILQIKTNKGKFGGAVNMIKSVFRSFGQIKIQENSADIGGALNAYASVLQFKGKTEFQDNRASKTGGGISAKSSTLQFHSHSSTVTFSNNSACYGGAIYFDQTSSLYIIKEIMESPCNSWYCITNTEDWMKFTFYNNSATKQGGAMYVNDTAAIACDSEPYERDPIYKECFLQTVAVYEKANDWNTTGINFANVHFINNTAPEGQGPLLYGGLLDRCAIDEYAEQLQNSTTKPNPLSYFIALTSNFTNNEVASDAVRVCLCEDDKTTNCSKKPTNIQAVRGKQFHVTVVVVNQIGTPMKGDVRAYLSRNNTSGRLAEDQYQQLTDERCTNLRYTVFSAQPEVLNLYAVGPCHSRGISKTSFVIDIDPNCPVGFAPSESSLECVCDPQISDFITNCSIETEMVQRKGNIWISSSIMANTTVHFIIHDCPHDYCRSPTEIVSINLTNFINGSDAQCAFNRAGLLCGSCREGYSLTLGSSRCLKCTHFWLLLTVPLFALAGIILMGVMMACNLTLASGTLNGLLFYANILIANQSTLFPYQKVNVLTVFVSWLGLNVGIPSCFFDGMDGLSKMWVQISFEAYLILLMIGIILMGKVIRVANFYHRYNLYPIHTLATVSMLSYEKLSRKVFSLVAFTTVEYHDGTRFQTVWLFDPNEGYLTMKHLPLMIVGVTIIFTGIIFNLTLIFYKVLIAKCRHAYLEQFMQAFLAPFKSSHQYWVGLLLLLRNVSYLTSELLNASQHPDYSLHVIFSLIVGILLLKFVFTGTPSVLIIKLFTTCRTCYRSLDNKNDDTVIELDRDISDDHLDNGHFAERKVDNESVEGIVYKNPYLDLLETSFLINLLVLTYFAMCLKGEESSQEILFYVSTSVVLLTFLGILTYHIWAYTSLKSSLSKLKRSACGKRVRLSTQENMYAAPLLQQSCTHSEV